MSVTKNIEFHIEETWRVDFTTHNSDGSVMTLPPGTAVLFRVNQGSTVLFDKSIGDGITITDENAGAGNVIITPNEQVLAEVKKGKTYSYELKVVKADLVSVQNIGNLLVLSSLFATAA